jgi:invasion protein IalB
MKQGVEKLTLMHRVLRLVMMATCLFPALAAAQATKDAPKANVPAIPERTTATFGDWTMRCEAAVAAAKRFCEVVLAITPQGQTNPIAQLAIGKPAPNESRRLTVVLPTNVAIVTKPQVLIAKAGAVPLELSWQRCTPGACFAFVPLSDEATNTLSAQSEPGRIVFKDAADRETTIPVSFRGLSQALATLAKEQ